jgi:hypothetical protein
MTRQSSVVEVFDAHTGDTKPYKLMSARIPDFLKEYPKTDGYQVKVSTTDMLHSKPGLIRLYEAAMAANMAPNQAGLPPLPDANIVIFTASLLDKDGKVLESASATRQLTGYPKEWEKGETAARQRLLAALGFGGDCFDEDEQSDIAALDPRKKAVTSNSVSDSDSAKKVSKPAKPTDKPQASDSNESAKPKESSAKAATESTPSGSDSADADSSKTGQKKGTAKASRSTPNSKVDDSAEEKIPMHLIRQIEHQAKLKGVEIPAPKNVKEAKAEVKRLIAL